MFASAHVIESRTARLPFGQSLSVPLALLLVYDSCMREHMLAMAV
jgi:hypothetical protein